MENGENRRHSYALICIKDGDLLFIECICIILGGILILPLLISSLHILPWLLAFHLTGSSSVYIDVCMCVLIMGQKGHKLDITMTMIKSPLNMKFFKK